MTNRHATIADVIHMDIAPALAPDAELYDMEAIARAAYKYRVDTNANGDELLNTAGFEPCVDQADFWALVFANVRPTAPEA